jgi:hypothetical protein
MLIWCNDQWPQLFRVYYFRASCAVMDGRQDHHSVLQYILCTFWWILTQLEKLPTRLATNMKFAGVNIYGHPNIWCEDQHRLTTKKFFNLELKRNRQFFTIRLPAPPITNGNNYEKTFALKLLASHATLIVISIQLQIKYIWLIKLDFQIFP